MPHHDMPKPKVFSQENEHFFVFFAHSFPPIIVSQKRHVLEETNDLRVTKENIDASILLAEAFFTSP